MVPAVAEPKDPGFWESVFRWLTSSSHGWELIGKWILLCALALIGLAWAVGYLAEKIAKLIDSYKDSGLPLTFDRKIRDKIRKRRQFCSVINADLAVLAKTENWNDQYFTDLEAEIEAEGGYYPSALHKLFRRKSRGLRRVPSLIEAIESSTEQALLLVGEPGSGKSVALRHLGHQLAQRGIRSADPKARIPLYINLKELNISLGNPSADTIKSFVLDNIRRGDADTVAFVRDNWEDFKFRGIWFFLFDSFDEIPAVLHAPTGGSVIRDYAEAIRQFLEGLGSCRGVLASREFKGPDALPWQKLRILPLNEARQDRLVDNSFLEPEQKDIVRTHLASSGSTLGNNPMFLTLLCRYVKEEGLTPANDHDLLSGHLDRLSSRDSDYIDRKYNLSPNDLAKRAVNLAVLFATSPGLSLAPTLADIASSLTKSAFSFDDLQNTLAALVDVKILRSDVQEAKPGDQRFSFSHRRYQETLFVRFLADNPSYLSPNALLTDSRWREYTVTLLQTCSQHTLEPLLEEACQLLALYERNQPRVEIVEPLGGELYYFNWEGDPTVPLLSLLQEGLARRLSLLTPQLSNQILRTLKTRWEEGDIYDRFMVVKLGGLLPQAVLKDYLLVAVNAPNQQIRSLAFQQATFIVDMPQGLAEWVRLRLSQRLLEAEKRSELIKLEALSSRLPRSVGSFFVLRRCLLLRRLLFPIHIVCCLIFFVPIVGEKLTSRNAGPPGRIIRRIETEPIFVFTVTLLFPLFLALVPLIFKPGGKIQLSPRILEIALTVSRNMRFPLIIWAGFGLVVLTLLYFKSAGHKLNTGIVVRGFTTNRLQGGGREKALALGVALLFCVTMVGSFLYSKLLFVIILGLLMATALVFVGIDEYRSRSHRRRLRDLVNSGLARLDLILRSESVEELRTWMEDSTKHTDLTPPELRSLTRLLLDATEKNQWPISNYPLFQTPLDPEEARLVLFMLEDRLGKSAQV